MSSADASRPKNLKPIMRETRFNRFARSLPMWLLCGMLLVLSRVIALGDDAAGERRAESKRSDAEIRQRVESFYQGIASRESQLLTADSRSSADRFSFTVECAAM